MNGFKLSGNILGPNEPFQGGNVWWNYGNALNPAKTTPFTNVVDNPFYGEGPGISTGGDHFPLPGFNLTFTESGLPKGTTWKVTVLGVGLSTNSTMITFLGAPDKNYSYIDRSGSRLYDDRFGQRQGQWRVGGCEGRVQDLG